MVVLICADISIKTQFFFVFLHEIMGISSKKIQLFVRKQQLNVRYYQITSKRPYPAVNRKFFQDKKIFRILEIHIHSLL